MSRIQCIIVEDEPLAVKILVDYVSQVPYLELRGTFRDAISASDYLHTHPVDLIFLDIHLPKLKGMAFLRTLLHPPAVIITTAYHQYAVEGFELNVTDYLLKPIEFERFLAAVNKVHGARDNRSKGNTTVEEKEFIFLTVQKRKVKIFFAEILYIESQREYVKVVTSKGEYVSKMSTHEIESLLPVEKFWRIHRSYIIAVDKIASFTADTIEVNGVSLPVGRGYKEIVDKLF